MGEVEKMIDREQFRPVIKDLYSAIQKKGDVDRIILYDSVARGDFNEGSDVYL